MLEELFNTICIDNLVVSEQRKVYVASFYFNVENKPEYNFFSTISSKIPSRDKLTIILENEREDSFAFNFVDGEIAEYNNYFSDLDGDNIIKSMVKIEKNIENNRLSVFNYNRFVEDLLSLDLERCMKIFSKSFLGNNSYLIFELFDENISFYTKTLYFVPHGRIVDNTSFNRQKRLELSKEVSYFYNLDNYELLPDDFKIEKNYDENPLCDLFKKITSILSLCFIANSAQFDQDKVKGIINGQKMIDYSLSFEAVSDEILLYRIYDWIYTGGNAVDKAIIARNMISMHCHNSITELDEKVMYSIETNYNLYLKNNVEKYLELKNKVAEFINEIVSKTGEYGMLLLEKFKGNLIAILVFLFSVILANLVTNQPLNNIFTKDITVLSEIILALSCLYIIPCNMQLKYELGKVIDSYYVLKDNYKNDFADEELNEIFQNDTLIKNVEIEVNNKKTYFIMVWILILIGFFIIVEYLSIDPPIHGFIDNIMENVKNTTIE